MERVHFSPDLLVGDTTKTTRDPSGEMRGSDGVSRSAISSGVRSDCRIWSVEAVASTSFFDVVAVNRSSWDSQAGTPGFHYWGALAKRAVAKVDGSRLRTARQRPAFTARAGWAGYHGAT
jgi:hypothetical protein